MCQTHSATAAGGLVVDQATREAVQRRTLRVLWFSAVLGRGAVSSMFPVSVLAISELLGSSRFAGLSTGASTVGSAIGAIQIRSIPLFLLAMVCIGVGMGTASLARYAAADLSTPERRGRDIGTVSSRQRSVLCCFRSSLVLPVMPPNESPLTKTLAASHCRSARLAFIALVVSQAVMVMVMVMTPLHMKAHGHTTGAVGAVISVHTAGMFAFAAVAGRASDRAADLSKNIASGAGALAPGVVLDMAGFHILSMVGMAAAGALLVHAFSETKLDSARLAA